MKFKQEIKKQFKGTRRSWSIYWKTYGGWRSIFSSTYFLSALIFTFLCFKAWVVESESWAWFNLCNSVLPNVLGFTLGGYAILLAFGSSKFMEAIAGDNPDEDGFSPFMEINATFLHFIIVQVVALIVSIFSLIWEFKTGLFAFFGFLLFSYAIAISIAAAFAILRLAKWYDDFITRKKNSQH